MKDARCSAPSPDFHFRVPLTIFQIACILSRLLLSPDLHSLQASTSVRHFTIFLIACILTRLLHSLDFHSHLASTSMRHSQISIRLVFHASTALTRFLLPMTSRFRSLENEINGLEKTICGHISSSSRLHIEVLEGLTRNDPPLDTPGARKARG